MTGPLFGGEDRERREKREREDRVLLANCGPLRAQRETGPSLVLGASSEDRKDCDVGNTPRCGVGGAGGDMVIGDALSG